MRVAAAYMRRSSQPSRRSSQELRIAPTAAIDSGQRSRTSSTKGTRRARLTKTPAQPQKNCGEVAITRSGRRTASPASVAVAQKDR